MGEEISEALARARQLVEELKASLADTQKTVERSRELIEESHKIIDKVKRSEIEASITLQDITNKSMRHE